MNLRAIFSGLVPPFLRRRPPPAATVSPLPPRRATASSTQPSLVVSATPAATAVPSSYRPAPATPPSVPRTAREQMNLPNMTDRYVSDYGILLGVDEARLSPFRRALEAIEALEAMAVRARPLLLQTTLVERWSADERGKYLDKTRQQLVTRRLAMVRLFLDVFPGHILAWEGDLRSYLRDPKKNILRFSEWQHPNPERYFSDISRAFQAVVPHLEQYARRHRRHH